MKLKLINAVGIAALVGSTFALAEHPGATARGASMPSRGNMATSSARLAENLANNPDSPGLSTALQRQADNIRKHADNGPDRVERPDRALTPKITDRPTPAAFGVASDRPLPPGLAKNSDRPLPPGLTGRDRPLPPGHAKK